MTEEQFKKRTKQLGLRIIRLVRVLPRDRAADIIGAQIVRSATGIGANYRAACRAKSVAHMISKLGDVEEETDETLFWLELIEGDELVSAHRLVELKRETSEILRMIVASINTLKKKRDEVKKSRKGYSEKVGAAENQGFLKESNGKYNRKSKIRNRK